MNAGASIRIYGGISDKMNILLHYRPLTWEEGVVLSRKIADGGEHRIAAMYPAGVFLREESPARSSRDLPTVVREESFPCTYMVIDPLAKVAPAAAIDQPAFPKSEPVALVMEKEDSLFDSVSPAW